MNFSNKIIESKSVTRAASASCPCCILNELNLMCGVGKVLTILE